MVWTYWCSAWINGDVILTLHYITIYIYSTFTVHYITLHCIHTYQPKSIKFQKQKSWFFIAEAFCGLIRWEDLKVRSTEEYLCPFGLIRCHFFRGRRQGRQPLNVCMYVCMYLSLSPSPSARVCMHMYGSIYPSFYLSALSFWFFWEHECQKRFHFHVPHSACAQEQLEAGGVRKLAGLL